MMVMKHYMRFDAKYQDSSSAALKMEPAQPYSTVRLQFAEIGRVGVGDIFSDTAAFRSYLYYGGPGPGTLRERNSRDPAGC